MAAASNLATEAELAALNTIEAIRAWSGSSQEVWSAFSAALGTVESVIVFGLLPVDVFKRTLRALRIPRGEGAERELTAVETIQLAMMWRVARQRQGAPAIDPLQPAGASAAPPSTPPGAPGPAAGETPTRPVKKVKCSTVIDQGDETEVRPLDSTEVSEFFNNHIEVTGAEPLEECSPSPEQISALYDKVCVRGEEPYADFSVFTPYGRRVQRALRMRSWMPQEDGTYRPVEVAGPPSFDAWYACYRVYRAVLLMLKYPATDGGLRVVNPACMEAYLENFRALSAEHPECWHLCAAAEDKCRMERMPRLRRDVERLAASGGAHDYDPRAPWIKIFQLAAEDDKFWDKEVRRPAIAFLARRVRAVPAMPAAVAAALANVVGGPGTDPGRGRDVDPLADVKRRKKRGGSGGGRRDGRGEPSLHPGGLLALPAPPPPEGGPPDGGGGHPKKQGKFFVTDRDGKQVCFTWARGRECATPCPNGRSHLCQLCLQPHRNADCPKGGGGKGSGKGKGK